MFGTTECGVDADCAGPGGTCEIPGALTDCQGGEDTIFEWVAALNAATFAGYSDWRIPNVNELQSIVHYGDSIPAVDPAFHTGCALMCTVTTCSCTRSDDYASATTYHDGPTYMWVVYFYDGNVNQNFKVNGNQVRAVRGGL
jgi:hypothetical protein